jgi:L-asparagine transporter-like permease
LFEPFWLRNLPLDDEFKKFIEDFTGYALLLVLMSTLSYFLFNRHLTVLLLVIWLQVLESALRFIQKKRLARKSRKEVSVTVENA